MPKDVLVTFKDGTTHVYKGAPDDITPDAIEARAVKDFGRPVANLSRAQDEAAAVAKTARTIGSDLRDTGTDIVRAALGSNAVDMVNTKRPARAALAAFNAVTDPTRPILGALAGINGLTNTVGGVIGGAIHDVTGGRSVTGAGNAPIEVATINGKKAYRFNHDGPWTPVPLRADGTLDADAIAKIQRPMITKRETQDLLGNSLANLLTFAVPGGGEEAAAEKLVAMTAGPAAPEVGAVARVAADASPAVGSSLPAVAAKAAMPNGIRANAARLQRAGVTPYIAIADPGKGKVAIANLVAENPVAGGMVRKRLSQSLSEVQDQANSLAGQYGTVRGGNIVGENMRAGIGEFANKSTALPETLALPARSTSFATKAEKAYQDAFAPIQRAEARRIENIPSGQSHLDTTESSQALKDINERFQGSGLSQAIGSKRLRQVSEALTDDAKSGELRFMDLRELRSWVREAQNDDDLRRSIPAGALERLERALTQDIYTNARDLAGEKALQGLRRADDFYRAGSERIKTRLSKFDKLSSDENLYNRILSSAGSQAGADTKSLIALKRSVSPQDWGDLAANVIHNMGRAKAGSQTADGAAWSVANMVTEWNKLSDRGKDVLFGSLGGGGSKATELRSALDDLAFAADQLKKVEQGANKSKTFVSAQTAGTLVGLANPHTTLPTAAGLAGMFATGEALTNPAVIRAFTAQVRANPSAYAPLFPRVRRLAKAGKPAAKAGAGGNALGESYKRKRE